MNMLPLKYHLQGFAAAEEDFQTKASGGKAEKKIRTKGMQRTVVKTSAKRTVKTPPYAKAGTQAQQAIKQKWRAEKAAKTAKQAAVRSAKNTKKAAKAAAKGTGTAAKAGVAAVKSLVAGLGTDEDNDIETLISSMENIARLLSMKMYEYGKNEHRLELIC